MVLIHTKLTTLQNEGSLLPSTIQVTIESFHSTKGSL